MVQIPPLAEGGAGDPQLFSVEASRLKATRLGNAHRWSLRGDLGERRIHSAPKSHSAGSAADGRHPLSRTAREGTPAIQAFSNLENRLDPSRQAQLAFDCSARRLSHDDILAPRGTFGSVGNRAEYSENLVQVGGRWEAKPRPS
jgi:hypothetical protein